MLNSTLAVVAVCYGLLHALAAAVGIFGLPLRVILWLSLWRYAYAVLRRVAQGHRELPAPGPETMNPFGELPLVVHFMLFPALASLISMPGALPPPLVWPAVLLLAALFPASAAMIALSSNFALALSPVHLARLIGGLGRSYAVLLAVLAAGGAAVALVRAVPWPALAGPVLVNMLDVWTVLALFALTGAMLRERRLAFDIPGEVEPDDERAARLRRVEWQRTLDDAYASLRSGLGEQGYAKIRALIDAEGQSLEIHQWLFDAMSRWESDSHALRLGVRFIARLVEAGLEHEALELYLHCRRRAPTFAPDSGVARVLAGYARSIGRHGVADELAMQAAAAWPAAPRAP